MKYIILVIFFNSLLDCGIWYTFGQPGIILRSYGYSSVNCFTFNSFILYKVYLYVCVKNIHLASTSVLFRARRKQFIKVFQNTFTINNREILVHWLDIKKKIIAGFMVFSMSSTKYITIYIIFFSCDCLINSNYSKDAW